MDISDCVEIYAVSWQRKRIRVFRILFPYSYMHLFYRPEHQLFQRIPVERIQGVKVAAPA